MAGAYKGFASRRAYDDSKAQLLGFRNSAEYQTLRKEPLYQRFIQIKAQNSGVSPRNIRALGPPAGRDFNRKYIEMRHSGEWQGEGRMRAGPTPKTAAFMREIGLGGRREDYKRFIHESPKLKGRNK